MSYTDQLKSLLEAHQTLNQQQQKHQINMKNLEQSATLNTNTTNKHWTSPISISTNNINNISTVQFNPNNNNNNSHTMKKSKIPLTPDVNKQMIMLNNTPLCSPSSSLSPTSQQLFLSSPNLSDSNDIYRKRERIEPPRHLELDMNIPLKASKSNQLISPSSLSKTEIKIDIGGFKTRLPEPESVYDLPTPPMEIFSTTPIINDYDSTVTNLTSFPSPSHAQLSPHTQTVQSQIIVQLTDNRSSKGPVPLVAPKPVFKRLNSFNNGISSESEVAMIKFNNFNKTNENQNKERKSFGMNSSHFRGSSLSRTSSLMHQQNQQMQNSDASNELTAILARQKKKIEEQTGDVDTFGSNISNQVINNNKMPSPNIAKKPPPPPRSDKAQFFTRKMSNEY